MSDPATNSENIFNQQIQSELLPGGNVTTTRVELTSVDLAQAAENLTMLRSLLIEVYGLAAQYDDAAFHLLNSSKTVSWTNFIVDIFIDIAAGLASGLAIVAEGPAAIPAIAFIAAILKEWGIGKDRPGNLEAVFAEFEFGRVAMQDALEDKLSLLIDPSNNYGNLTAAWKDPITFNGKTYTLDDLASTKFTYGPEYNKLHDAAYTFLKQCVWNLLIMRCCSYYKNWGKPFGTTKVPGAVLEHVQTKFYSSIKGVYARARLVDSDASHNYYYLTWWNLGINGYPFPEEASIILFKDDAPDHIINPKGLFNRSYVFQQFSTTKPNFDGGHELGNTPGHDFADSDDWNFTGGMFPKQTQ